MILYILSLLPCFIHLLRCASIVDVISNIAHHEQKVLPEGLEVCYLQIRNYSERGLLDDTVIQIVKALTMNFPVTISRQRNSVYMYGRRDASLVLVDASGYGEKFSSDLGQERLRTHECYSMSAKFIVIVDVATNRSTLARFFRGLGVVNYLAVPLDVCPDTPDPIVDRLYTVNPFTGHEYLFDVRDHDVTGVGRYFPDKLTDVAGYEFLGFALYEFPYLFEMRDNRTAGILMEALRWLIGRKLNGTIRMVPDERTDLGGRTEFDLTFAYTDFRLHYMHDVTCKERSGHCVLCPFRTERDFLRHLLKPFSVGIWLVLGALVAVVLLLGRLLPRWFRRDLLEQIFFTASAPYRQPFPTRAVSFTVAVLIFFLSEAYNAKIISLMSVSKYHDRPETVQELLRSDLKIAMPGVRSSLMAEVYPGLMISNARAQAIYQKRGEEMFSEFCTVTYCYMASLMVSGGRMGYGFQQYVLRDLVLEKPLILQLATRSPFYRTFQHFFEQYFQSGIWMYRREWLNRELIRYLETLHNRIDEVVFHFEDLSCIWVLIVVGWALGAVALAGELLWVHVHRLLCNPWQRSNGPVFWSRSFKPIKPSP